MNISKSARVRIVLAFLLLAIGVSSAVLAAPPPATSTFRFFVDADPGAAPATGCQATTTKGTSLSGIDQVVTITVDDRSAPAISATLPPIRQVCSKGAFGPPSPAPGALGPVFGKVSDIETALPVAGIPGDGARVYFDSIYNGSNVRQAKDELLTLTGAGTGKPILVFDSVDIPTLSEWGLALLAFALSVSAFVVLRRRGAGRRAAAGVLLLVLSFGAGVAWAATLLVVDGIPADWSANVATVATDAQGDAMPNADIEKGYGAIQLNAARNAIVLFLRLDVKFAEAPELNHPPVVKGATFSIAEHSPNGTNVGTPVTFTDPDVGQAHTFAITAGNPGIFAIDPSTGQITVASSTALDFEATPIYRLTVQVTDDGTPNLSGSATITIKSTNANEAPTVDAATFTIPEDAAIGSNVGTPVRFFDQDAGQTHTFAITAGNTGNAFSINAATGQITVASALNATSNPTYSLTVQVTDNGTPILSGTATITINVTAAGNQPPVADNDIYGVDQGGTLSVAAPGVLDGDTDPDGDSLSAVLVSGPVHASTFALNPNGSFNYTHDGSAATSDSFTYKANDGSLDSNVATVTITISPVDDPPKAVNDTATVNEDAPATAVDVLTNDTDTDGGPKTIASVTQPANGTVVITGGGTGLTYKPNANYCNTPIPPGTADTFSYTLAQGGPMPTATVSMTVTCVDDLPVAVADAATVNEDAPATAVNVLANDTDPDGGPKTIASVTQPANGAVVITGGGTGLTYQPNPNYCNTPIPPGTADTFTYTLAQGGPTPTATVSMTVTCQDDPPTAVNDAATVNEDAPATAVDVLSNDTDIDGGPKTIASVTQPANGAVVITGGGTGLTYQPNPNYCNTPIPPGTADTFTYTLAQGGATPTATVSMTVTCQDDPPTAVNDAATVNEDAPATAVDVLTNDTDIDGGPKTIASVTQPANGAVVITGGGTGLTYQPNPNYCNTPIPPGTADTFTYTLAQGGPSPTSTVSMTVTCVDDPPTAVNDAATVNEDAPATAVDVLSNDTDPDGGPKSIASVTQPANGAVVITGGGTGLTYQPNPNYCNTPIPPGTADTFTYTLAQGGPTPTATVSMTVTCQDDPPTAVNDAATVNEDAPATAVDVLSNDTDIDGGPKSIASVTQPANGAVVITGGGTGLTYQPNPNYCNTPIPPGTADTFTYTLAQGGLTPTAMVSMTVTCVNDGPVLDLDGGTGGSDFATTFTEGQPLPQPIEAADATITDIDSTTLTSLTVTLTNLLDPGFEVLDVDLTGADPAFSKNYDTTTDPSKGVLTISASPARPIAEFVTLLRKVTYDNTDDNPDITARAIEFVANDGTTNSNVATTTVTMAATDDPPKAVNDAATVNEDAPATAVDVLSNDTDPDGGPKSILSVTQPANGAVVITGGGTGLTYQPSPNYCNTPIPPGTADTFTYTLAQGGPSPTATVSMTVTCADDPPVAVNDAATVAEDAAATAIPVLANDTDVDGGPKTIASVTQPLNGTVVPTGGSPGAFTGLTYQPNPNYCNTPIPPGTPDTFTYTLTQGGPTPTATVSMTVTCVDDAPVAVNDSATVTEDDPATAIPVLANDTDVDGGPKTIASVTQPANGTVVPTGGSPGAFTGLTYQPNPNYCNTPIPPGTADTFTYTLTQGGPTPTATVSMTVTCVDDPPMAVNDSATVTEDSLATAVLVLANDTDVDGGPKTIASATQPANGMVVLTGGSPGAFTGLTYRPNSNYCNTPIPPGTADTFTYTLTQGGPTPTATVSMTVTCVNDPPTDIALSKSDVDENQPINTVVGTFSTTDVDFGDTHVYTLVGGAGSTDNGSFNISGNQLRTSAAFNFEVKSSYSIRVQTQDQGGTGLTFQKIFTITVNDLPEAPNANIDTFDTIGNTELRVDLAAGTTPNVAVTTPVSPANRGVLHNDTDDDAGQTDTLAVSGIVGCTDTTAPFGDGPVCTTTNGGTVLMQSDGRFSYFPKVGDLAASDSFTYTARDSTSLTSNGTVTINRFQRVWYVKNNDGGGTGVSNDPFATLAEAQTASSANDYIFVHFGDGTTTGQAAGIALKNGQHLIGEFAGLTITFTPAITFNGVAGTTSVPLLAQPGPTACSGNPCRPMLDDTVAGAPEGVGATDAIPVEIVGLNLAGNVNGIDWTTTAAFAGTGTLTIRDNVIRSAGAEGVDINLAGTGATNLSFHDNNITSTGTGLDSQETGTGALTITAFDDNVVSGSTGGSGININTAIFDSVPGGAINTVDGGTTVIGASGNGVGGAGMILANVQGDLHFTGNLNIFADGGTGLGVSGTGVGMQLRVNSGGAPTGIVEAINGPAVDATAAALDLRLTSAKSTNSASTGVSLTNVTGTFSAESGSSITNSTGTDFNISGGTANVTYKGTITDDVGQLVSVASTTGGTKSFTGAITDGDDGDGSGISLSSNTGATIRFTGGVVLNTGPNAAFAATGGGTVEVCDEDPCNPGATGLNVNKITTTTATALNVANTTIGSNNLEFRSISAGTAASGPASGIVLNNTGASGGLTVKGTGSAGSGGTIQKTTSSGISLTSTLNFSASFMNINTSGDDGINGSAVNGFSLISCSLADNGNGVIDEGVELNNPAGTLTFTNTSVTRSFHNNVKIDMNNVNVTAINVTGGSFTNNKVSGSGANGFFVAVRGTSTLGTSLVSGTAFADTVVSQLKVDAADTATVTSFTAQNCTFSGISGNAVDFTQAQSANAVYRFLNNSTITGHQSHAINVFSASSATGGTIQARIQGNTIGNSGSAGSGSATGNGIRVLIQGRTVGTVLLDGNVIRQVPVARGIDAQFLGPTTSGQPLTQSDITVTNNDVNPQDSTGFPTAAIYVAADSQGGSPVRVRSDVRLNTVPAGAAFDILPTFIVVDEVVAAAEAQLVDTAPASANCTAQLTSTNAGSASAVAGCALIAGPINTPP
jgi:hypothetical protein